jgi:hypothetical protein
MLATSWTETIRRTGYPDGVGVPSQTNLAAFRAVVRGLVAEGYSPAEVLAMCRTPGSWLHEQWKRTPERDILAWVRESRS